MATALQTSSLMAAAPSETSNARGLVVKTSKLTPPEKGSIPVAVLISEGLNVIDFSGPWGVFRECFAPKRN